MKESVFGEEETEDVKTEYGDLPGQRKIVEQAVLYCISEQCKTSTLHEKNRSKRENFFDKLKQLHRKGKNPFSGKKKPKT